MSDNHIEDRPKAFSEFHTDALTGRIMAALARLGEVTDDQADAIRTAIEESKRIDTLIAERDELLETLRRLLASGGSGSDILLLVSACGVTGKELEPWRIKAAHIDEARNAARELHLRYRRMEQES